MLEFGRPVPPLPLRRFALSDLMILVAGTALGCAWTRSNWYNPASPTLRPIWDVWGNEWHTAIQLPTPLLFSLAIAALICRFIPTCPTLRQVGRQPGVITLAILTFVMAINATVTFVSFALEFFLTQGRPEDVFARAPFLLPDPSELFIYQGVAAGPSVIVCWSIQFFTDHWEPEPSWIDRLGRVLGFSLILIEVCWLLDCFARLDFGI